MNWVSGVRSTRTSCCETSCAVLCARQDFKELGVEGALTGTPAAGDATLKFSAMSEVAAMVETLPLERAAEAYAHMMSGKARFRMVLTMV